MKKILMSLLVAAALFVPLAGYCGAPYEEKFIVAVDRLESLQVLSVRVTSVAVEHDRIIVEGIAERPAVIADLMKKIVAEGIGMPQLQRVETPRAGARKKVHFILQVQPKSVRDEL